MIDRDAIFNRGLTDDQMLAALVAGGMTEQNALAEIAIYHGEPFEDVIEVERDTESEPD